MAPAGEGFFFASHPQAEQGWRYAFVVDGEGPYPDPASRGQPDGVHGWSELYAEAAPLPTEGWRGIDPARAVLYEIHIGTFTAEGTYRAAMARIPHLRDLGVTALSLMPLAAFPGRRNWGYDGTFLFAPAACYGSPDELRAFIGACHAAGLGVLLDVVYNHFGPDGNYLWPICRDFFDPGHPTPWGDAIAIGHPVVASFFEENIRYWIQAFGFDGFRFDAVHALPSAHRVAFLEGLARAARDAAPAGHRPYLVLENRDNEAGLLGPGHAQYDAQWNDDYRYAIQALLQAEHGGVYADFLPAAEKLERVLRESFAFQGEWAGYYGRHRGSPSAHLPARHFVNFIQSHDIPGNRPLGERLHHLVPEKLAVALGVFTLLLPSTPMLFMGEEFGASSPFLFFTDHHTALGEAVREGRLAMFKRRIAVDRLAVDTGTIPDPQDPESFGRSTLDWREAETPGNAFLPHYRAALSARRDELADLLQAPHQRRAEHVGGLYLMHMATPAHEFLLAANLSATPTTCPLLYHSDAWSRVVSTEASALPEAIPGHCSALWKRPR